MPGTEFARGHTDSSRLADIFVRGRKGELGVHVVVGTLPHRTKIFLLVP